MKYSMLFNNGKHNFQGDYSTPKEARKDCMDNDYLWAVIIEVETGKLVALYNKKLWRSVKVK